MSMDGRWLTLSCKEGKGKSFEKRTCRQARNGPYPAGRRYEHHGQITEFNAGKPGSGMQQQ